MSQLRVMLGWVRSAIVAVSICATLIAGSAFPASAHYLSDTASITVSTQSATHASCAHAHALPSNFADATPTQPARLPIRKHGSGHHCPDCCFFAGIGDWALSERPLGIIQSLTDISARLAYPAKMPNRSQGLLMRAAHGARAPPVTL